MTSVRDDGEVQFRFYRPGVGSVLIVGDFGFGQVGSFAMEDGGQGWWVARATLSSGEYRFGYEADGDWFADYASHGVEFDREKWHGVLLVPERTQENHENFAKLAA